MLLTIVGSLLIALGVAGITLRGQWETWTRSFEAMFGVQATDRQWRGIRFARWSVCVGFCLMGLFFLWAGITMLLR